MRDADATLEPYQALVARLYTDPSALAALEAGGGNVAAPPPDDAANRIEGIDLAGLRRFAQSLRSKRAHVARRHLPFTAVALGARFLDRFHAYAPAAIPAGARKPLADAMTFAASLARSPDVAIREAARFDAASMRLRFRITRAGRFPVRCEARRRRGCYVALRRFAYEFPGVAGDPPPAGSWPLRSTLVLFVNVAGRCGVWYW
jgi:hypothetical protein